MTINDLSEDDYVCLPKNAFLLNTLAMGIALQVIAKLTEEPLETWKGWVRAKADEQYHQLSEAEVQKILDDLKNSLSPDEAT